MRAVVLLTVAMIAGCAHAPATTVTGGAVSVHGHGHSLAAVVIAGMFMAAAIDYSREPRPMPSFSSFADWFRGAPPPPEMDAERSVLEHDCTQPLPQLSGNLKCR